MINIKQESNSQLNNPLDFSRKSKKYRTKNGLFIIPSPEIQTIEKNIFYLLKNSVEKKFDVKYSMKPSYLSYDEYGNPNLGELLMIVNNIYCLEDFDISMLQYISVPSITSIIKINVDNCKMFNDYSKIEEICW